MKRIRTSITLWKTMRTRSLSALMEYFFYPICWENAHLLKMPMPKVHFLGLIEGALRVDAAILEPSLRVPGGVASRGDGPACGHRIDDRKWRIGEIRLNQSNKS